MNFVAEDTGLIFSCRAV